MPNHFQQLLGAFQHEWNSRAHYPALENAYLEHDGTRYWWIYDASGNEIIKWECRNFPGCASLVITTKVELRENMRGQGFGRYFREMRHRAYKRAGFVGEIATVRSDNAAQNRLMETMNGVRMGTFPSDFGGTYVLWLTSLQQPAPRNPHIGSDFNAFMVSEEAGAAEAAYQAPLTAPVITPAPVRRKPKTFAHRNGK
jgi:hypothetical protein